MGFRYYFRIIIKNLFLVDWSNKVATKEHYNDFLKLKRVLSLIKENEVLIRVGAYKKGMDLELDSAIAKKEKAREFLTQGSLEKYSFDDIIANLRKVLI